MSTKLEFPCLSMDVNQWFSSGSSSSSDSDIAVVREALKNFLMDPLMLDEEEKKDESTTTLNTQWLLNTPTTTRPAKNNSSGSSTPMMTPSDNIMAPVLRETSRDYWLLAGNKNNVNNKEEEEVERAPVTDRVPNPSTSLWLAANTDSISSQTAANNITWPQGSTINNNKWLLHSEQEDASKPAPEWLYNWKVATKGSNWLPVAPTGSQWLASASGAVDWLSMSTSTLSTGSSSNPLEDWPLKDTDCSEWLLDASEPEVAPRKRPLSPVIMMWLESAMEEEELEADEEEEDNESSIVVLSEPGTGSDIGAASMEEDGDDDLGFWLL